MPGLEVMSTVMDSQVLERPLLRSHKALPRRGVVVPNIEIIQPASPDHLTRAPALPLTPPGIGQGDLAASDEPTPRKPDSSLLDAQTGGMLTPRHPSKPPTPDVTPPRTNSTKRPPLNQCIDLSSSSRAESFQTARESMSSDTDMETPVRSSRPMSRKPKHGVHLKSNGLNGIHANGASAKETPSSGSQHVSETEYETGFESFDGDWGTSQKEDSPTPRARTGKPGEDRHRSGRKSDLDHDDALDVEHLDASLMKAKTLRDRVHSRDVAASVSMERFREDIGWPSSDITPSQSDNADTRRFSGVSSTSTVEVMIIDSPKRAKRTLRHTEKRNSLRSASSPITRSERTSVVSSSESQHRLIHKAARISDQDRRSVSSDISFSTKTTTSALHPNVEIIPVVVVPERRSSLQSAPNSHVSSKPGSRRSSQHPPTGPASSIDAPWKKKKRTMSDSVSTRSQETTDARGRRSSRPIIPPRSSSLSAPTSQNNSRATSLTSASLRSHTLAMDLEMQKQRQQQQPVSPPRNNVLGAKAPVLLEPPNLQAVIISSDDLLQPPSLPFTPSSIPSSSPGPIEIQEATAISLFAHNNHSLLLVDPRGQAQPRGLHGLGLQPTRGNTTPDRLIQGTAHVESPLRNPRPPPKPPTGKPLPPLPLPGKETSQNSDGPLGRRWNSVRQTLGNTRPRSDSFNTLARSFSMKSAKNRKSGMEIDSKLHPFWRPRGFWENVPGSPKKEDSSGQRDTPNTDEGLIINNSLGLPQYRVVIDGPPSLARRSPEMRRLFDGMSSTLQLHHNASRGSLADRKILRTGSPLYQHRYRALSRWGLRLRAMSLRNMRSRLRRVRQRREERKRAARRETLKQSIGGPVYVASSATHGVVAS
ncbi:hypothetical protein N7474_009454 [Penicillium riverlandense]|uniref:uncharacterized protein n=1 Tax=Penicillium riverlandense TaxID=1903569 RepID=UPI002546A658|nr:uncharacterized protein N7474_009454 [Penicillium riverlandense]KAJ5808185.1 hypothetical protein N7474_009454 [Penicillium riverlandense]